MIILSNESEKNYLTVWEKKRQNVINLLSVMFLANPNYAAFDPTDGFISV